MRLCDVEKWGLWIHVFDLLWGLFFVSAIVAAPIVRVTIRVRVRVWLGSSGIVGEGVRLVDAEKMLVWMTL